MFSDFFSLSESYPLYDLYVFVCDTVADSPNYYSVFSGDAAVIDVRRAFPEVFLVDSPQEDLIWVLDYYFIVCHGADPVDPFVYELPEDLLFAV